MTFRQTQYDTAEESRLRTEINASRESVELIMRKIDEGAMDAETRQRASQTISYHTIKIQNCERMLDAITAPATSRVGRKPRRAT